MQEADLIKIQEAIIDALPNEKGPAFHALACTVEAALFGMNETIGSFTSKLLQIKALRDAGGQPNVTAN